MYVTSYIAKQTQRNILSEGFSTTAGSLTAESCILSVINEIENFDSRYTTRKRDILEAVVRETGPHFKTTNERKVFETIAKYLVINHITHQKRSSLIESYIRKEKNLDNSLSRLYESGTSSVLAEKSWLSRAISGVAKKARDLVYSIPGIKKLEKNRLRKMSAKKLWRIITGKEGAGQEYDDLIDKFTDVTIKRRQKIIDKFGEVEPAVINAMEAIKDEDGNDFPNVKTFDQFVEGIGILLSYYVKVVNAAGFEAKIPNIDDKPETDPTMFLPTDEANEVIGDLRVVLQKVSDDLYDLYTRIKEHRQPAKLSDLLLVEEEEDIRKAGSTTKEMKELRSNTLPGVIAAFGLGGMSAGVAAQIPWVQKLIQDFVTQLSGGKTVRQAWSTLIPKAIETLAPVGAIQKGQGLTQFLETLPGSPKLSTGNVPIEKFFDTLTMHFGSPDKGIEALSTTPIGQGFKNPAAAQKLLNDLWQGVQDGSVTGTIGQHIGGDVGVTGPLALDPGVILKKVPQIIVTKLTGHVAKQVPKVTLQAIAGAGLAATGVGALGLGVAGLIKLLRRAGAEDSRASYIQAMLDLLKDVPEKEEIIDIPGDDDDSDDDLKTPIKFTSDEDYDGGGKTPGGKTPIKFTSGAGGGDSEGPGAGGDDDFEDSGPRGGRGIDDFEDSGPRGGDGEEPFRDLVIGEPDDGGDIDGGGSGSKGAKDKKKKPSLKTPYPHLFKLGTKSVTAIRPKKRPQKRKELNKIRRDFDTEEEDGIGFDDIKVGNYEKKKIGTPPSRLSYDKIVKAADKKKVEPYFVIDDKVIKDLTSLPDVRRKVKGRQATRSAEDIVQKVMQKFVDTDKKVSNKDTRSIIAKELSKSKKWKNSNKKSQMATVKAIIDALRLRGIVKEGFSSTEESDLLVERWQRMAGILVD